jgi:hypothetical protein
MPAICGSYGLENVAIAKTYFLWEAECGGGGGVGMKRDSC